MKKNTDLKAFYFPHDIGACNDPKLIDLRIRFGWKAIGMFWAITEALHKEDNGSLPKHIISSMILDFYLQEEIRESRHIREEVKEFENLLYANALLIECDGITTSLRVQENLQKRMEKSKKAKASAMARWGNNKPNNANAMRLECERNAIKERKGKEIKVKESKYMSEKDFDIFWELYPNKVNKSKAKKKFLNIKKDKLDNILDSIKKYKLSDQWKKENGKFIPHPTTWLNGERWEDEFRDNKIDWDNLTDEEVYLKMHSSSKLARELKQHDEARYVKLL